MEKLDQYLKIATLAAKKSGQIFKSSFGQPKHVDLKNGDPNDFVTEADKKIETLIRKIIKKKFPEHKIIGEEFAKDSVNGNDLVWIIDPIDGTTNYIYGIALCCISIAVWDKKGPLVGVIYNPILEQMYTAARGRGTKLNGKKVRVSKTAKLNQALGTLGWARERDKAKLIFSYMIDNCLKLRVFATGAWQMCLTASGHTDFYTSLSENLWDFAAGALIVTEAGGKVTDLKGLPVNSKTNNIIATNGKIHHEVLNKLKKLA